MAAASALGCREVRVTLEWARLERRPGERDEGALDRYLAALRAAAGASMRTVAVLCDAAWPSWLGQEPWLSAWAPQRFAAHAAWVGASRWRAGRCRRDVPHAQRGRTGGLADRDEAAVPRGCRRRRGRARSTGCSSPTSGRWWRSRASCPRSTCALLLGVAPRYEDAALWRDVAAGIADPVVLRRTTRALRRAAGDSTACGRRDGRGDDASPTSPRSARHRGGRRSHRGSAGSRARTLDLLAVALDHAEGTIGTVELGAGPHGWDAQLARGTPRPACRGTRAVRSVHLHGLVGSTGPLADPVGLVDVRPARRDVVARDRRARATRVASRRSEGTGTRRRGRVRGSSDEPSSARSRRRPRTDHATARPTTRTATPMATTLE